MDVSTYYNFDFFPGQVPYIDINQNILNGQLMAYEETLSCNEEVNPISEVTEALTEETSIPLPIELTNMFLPQECKLCGITVTCETSALTHYEGKSHIRKVNYYMKEHYNLKGSLKLKREHFTPVNCEVCNVQLTSSVVYQQHFSGKQHWKNLKKKEYNEYTLSAFDSSTGSDGSFLRALPPPPIPPKLSDFVCEICNVSTNTEKQLKFHKNGQKHKKRLSKLKELRLNNAIDKFYSDRNAGDTVDTIHTNSTFEEVSETSYFIENPDMDYPLEFNTDEDCETVQSESSECQKNGKWHAYVAPVLSSIDSMHEQITLEKTNEILTDSAVKNKKLVSSTGLFLQQLALISKKSNKAIDCQEQNIDTNYVLDKNSENQCSTLHLKSNDETNSSEVVADDSNLNSESKNFSQALKNISSIQHAEKHSNTEPQEKNNDNENLNTDTHENATIISKQVLENTDRENEVIIQKENSTDKNSKSVKDPEFDKVLTKLAIEELVKESSNFDKKHFENDSLKSSIDQAKKSEYEHYPARSKITDKVEKYEDNNRKEGIKIQNSYSSWSKTRFNSNRWYNYRRNYQRNNHNYRVPYNKYNGYSSYYRNYEKRDSKYNERNLDGCKKRKRYKDYSSDEEYKHKTRNSNTMKQQNGKYKSSSTRLNYASRRSRNSESSSDSNSSNECKQQKYKYQSKRVENETKVSNLRKKRNRSSSESSSSSSSKSSSYNHDYWTNKDGWCEKRHRCKKAYNNCQYKHKKSFEQMNEKTAKVKDDCTNLWNPEPPVEN